MNALIELARLRASQPTLSAPITEVAAWYEAKSALLADLAATAPTVDEHDHDLALARTAHQHALALTRSGV